MARDSRTLHDINLPMVKALLESGHDDKFICKLLEMSKEKWKALRDKNPDFNRALKDWKALAVSQVEKKLFERAVGYDFPEEKIFQHEGMVIRVDTTKHVPPDIGAIKYFLNNQSPQEWQDKQNLELSADSSFAQTLLKARRRSMPELEESKAEVDEDYLE